MKRDNYSQKKVRRILLILIAVILSFLCVMLIILAFRNLEGLFTPSEKAEPDISVEIPLATTETAQSEPSIVSTLPAHEEITTDPVPSSEPTEQPTEITDPTDATSPGSSSNQSSQKPGNRPGSSQQPQDGPPPSVTIPPEEDPETGAQILTFPCQIPGYDLVIEKLAPYTGIYVEDGTNQQITDVAMLMVSNNGTTALEYAEINVAFGEEMLTFHISALPAGERLVAQEAGKKQIPDKGPTGCSALVIQNSGMEAVNSSVSVKDDGKGGLIIENLTADPIPTVRVFYKYYMADEDVFIGGIAFTVKVSRLPASGTTTVRPSHFSSESSRIVMISCYDIDA